MNRKNNRKKKGPKYVKAYNKRLKKLKKFFDKLAGCGIEKKKYADALKQLGNKGCPKN